MWYVIKFPTRKDISLRHAFFPFFFGLTLAAVSLSASGCGSPTATAPGPIAPKPAPGTPIVTPATPTRPAPSSPTAMPTVRVKPVMPSPQPHSTTESIYQVKKNRNPNKKPSFPAPPGAPKPVPVYWFGSPSGGHVYITIDDGWDPSPKVLTLMRAQHLPLTTFLIEDAAKEHPSFWRAFVAAGGVIEDHTLSHPNLATISYNKDVLQWSSPRLQFAKWFHSTVTLGRPPYGGLDTTVAQAAAAAGLKGVVMWSAEVGPKGIQTWNGESLKAGDIILLHWDADLYAQLQLALKAVAARHLTVAPLLSGLPPAAR